MLNSVWNFKMKEELSRLNQYKKKYASSCRANTVDYISTEALIYSPNYLFLTITIYTLPKMTCQGYGIKFWLLNWHSDISRSWLQSLLLFMLLWTPYSSYSASSFFTSWTNFTTLQPGFSCSIYHKCPIFSLFKHILHNSNSNSLPWSRISNGECFFFSVLHVFT